MTETIRFREGGPEDRDAVLALRRAAFPTVDVEKCDPDFWEWEFVHGYAGRGRVFLAEDAGRVVGHLGFVPQQYGAARGALAVDAMTHPDYQHQRVFSRLARFAAGEMRKDVSILTAYQIRRNVLPGMIAGGWYSFARIPILLKVFWSRKRSLPEARALTAADLPRVAELSQTLQPRTAEFLEWRFLGNPRWKYQIDGYFEDDSLRAFVISRRTVLRGVPTLAIADAGGWDSPLNNLLRYVCDRDGARPGLAAAFISRPHPAYHTLRRSGFFPGPHRFHLLLQTTGELRSVSWALTWGDTDHL